MKILSRNPILFLVFGIISLFNTSLLKAQIAFSDATSSLENPAVNSGVAMGVLDLNGDNLDDIVRLDQASNLEIEYQQDDGSFVRLDLGGGIGSPWGMTFADIDENGFVDILVGGSYDGLKQFKADNTGTSFSSSLLNGPDIFLQNANFADIDNDGKIDFFACHDDGLSTPYKNDGTDLLFDAGLINTESTVVSDNSGNYGSIWTDYDNDGDIDLYISKCRQGVDDPMDGRRLNLLFQNDGNGNYTDVAEASGLRPLTQTWSSNFEDIDNDGDLDVVMINHFTNHMIFENNGDGTFTDVTSSTGIEDKLLEVGFGIQVMMEDFDNDTYIDIFMTTLNGVHKLFRNNGDFTFSEAVTPFVDSGTRVQSAATGDLNNDGFVDLIVGYANSFNNPSSFDDQLLLNDGNANNWSKIRLEGVESNIDGIGARIEYYGDWGMQIREVRAGESYGTQNSMTTHFGASTFGQIEKIIVRWPSGITDLIENPAMNTLIEIKEGDNALGIEDFSDTSISLYPNPASNVLNITSKQFSEDTIKVYDLSGRLLLEQKVVTGNLQQIPTATLPQGMYFVQLNTETLSFIKK